VAGRRCARAREGTRAGDRRRSGGDPRAIPALIDCVSSCADPIRRASAANFLLPHVSVRDEPVLDALLEAASDEDGLVRDGAVFAMGESGAVIPPLRIALQAATADELRAVRVDAAWGLRNSDLVSLNRERRGMIETAWVELVASMETRADEPETHHTLGLFYAARDEPERAIQAYRDGIALAPAGIPSRHNLAMLLLWLGREDEALAEFEALVDIDPTFAPATYELGMLYGRRGRWREAIAAYTACLKAEATYPNALHELAHAYLKLDQGDLANHVLEAALKYPGEHEEALATLITVNAELGRWDVAKHWASVAIQEGGELAADPGVQAILTQ
jgi:tetratricopeptide (TPR) repeat protein